MKLDKKSKKKERECPFCFYIIPAGMYDECPECKTSFKLVVKHTQHKGNNRPAHSAPLISDMFYDGYRDDQ